MMSETENRETNQTTAQEEVSVQLEFTPNPDTLKYAVNRSLIPSGAANFTSASAAQGKSPLAEALLSDTLISAVMIGTNFITVTVKDQGQLMELNQRTVNKIKDFLTSGRPVVLEQSKSTPTNHTEIEKKIIEILDKEVRPAVAMDGGDISFEKFEDGFVYLRMQGSCAGCPSSMMTLKMGVETRLKDAIPEVIEVIPV